MTGAMSQLKDVSPVDKWQNASSPVFPLAKRYDRSDQVVGEGKGMIKQVKEDLHEFTHGYEK